MSSLDRATAALESLKAGKAAGRLAHSYLMVGSPRGEGLTFALATAQLVLCEGLVAPCGACDACDRVAARNHPDVFWLEPEKKSRIITIAAVRDLNGLLAQKSYGGGWKVAILLHADRLNQEGANAFLKTLEEPPPRTLILLVTDAPQGMLPTIISRCQRIQLSAGDRPVQNPWTPALLDILARPLGGDVLDRMVRAREVNELLADERVRIEDEVDTEVEEAEEEINGEVRDARVESQVKQIRSDLLHTMLLWQRDVLLVASGGDDALLHFPERMSGISGQAKRGTTDSLISSIQGLETLIRRLERNVKPDILSFEACFLTREN